MQHAHTKLRMEDLTLWFIEKGPIREMVEVAFETALFRAEREAGQSVVPAVAKDLHDRIVAELFRQVIEESHHIRREGEQYVLSPAGQRELQAQAIGSISEALRGIEEPAASALPPRWDVLLHPPVLLRCFAKFLSPRNPGP